MKIPILYVHDENGKVIAVQIPVDVWKKILTKLRKYEQALQIRSDLKEAFEQVASIKAQKGQKQSLAEFLHEV